MKPLSPTLTFYFRTANATHERLCFTDPMKVVKADVVDEVIPVLEQVENAVKNGYYAAGFLSYEAAPAFDRAYVVRHQSKLPLLWFGIFSAPVEMEYETDFSENSEQAPFHLSEWVPSVQPETYAENIQRIHDAIAAGDTYQVIYSFRLRASFSGDDQAFFQQLLAAQKANYAAYLNTGRHKILSVSP